MRTSSRFLLSLYGALGVIMTFTAILFYFVFVPNPYLTPYLLGWINGQGWGQFQVKNIAVRPYRIVMQDVSYVPAPTLAPLNMDSADLEITWEGLSPQITNVILKNLTISHATLENVMSGSSAEEVNLPPLTFENATVNATDMRFPFVLSFDGTYDPTAALAGKFRITFPEGILEGTTTATLAPSMTASFVDLSLSLKEWPHLPLKGQGKVTFDNNQIAATLTGTGPELTLKGQCTYAVPTALGGCTLTYDTPKIEKLLSEAILQEHEIQHLKGAMKGSTRLTIKNGISDPLEGDVAVSGLSFLHPLIHMEGLSTRLQYRFDKGLSFPPQTFTLQARGADVGVPLSSLQLQGTWDGKSNFHLETGSAALAGGQISTQNVDLALPLQHAELSLKAENIPVQFFITLSGVPHLNVSGNVEGTLNVEFTPDDYGIKPGSTLFIQNPPGTIEYRPGVEPQKIETLTGNEHPMDLVFLALWDFQYQMLSLDIEKPLQGDLQGTLQLQGKNPDLLDGHTFKFNIKVSGQLKELIESVLKSISHL